MFELRRLLRERDDRRSRLGRRTGKAEVRAVDPELIHELEEAPLDVEWRVADRGALQAVAERLVIELDGAIVRARGAPIAIPVVDQLVELGLHATYGASATRVLGLVGTAAVPTYLAAGGDLCPT